MPRCARIIVEQSPIAVARSLPWARVRCRSVRARHPESIKDHQTITAVAAHAALGAVSAAALVALLGHQFVCGFVVPRRLGARNRDASHAVVAGGARCASESTVGEWHILGTRLARLHAIFAQRRSGFGDNRRRARSDAWAVVGRRTRAGHEDTAFGLAFLCL